MNLFDLHADKSKLKHHEREHEVPENAYRQAKKLGKRVPELESVIARDAKWAYTYARDVLKGPFKLGEPAIAKDPKWAYTYARDVLPFKLGEPAIAKDSKWAYTYARDVLKGPFKLGEPAIAKDPQWASWYASDVRKGPFKLGEPVIAKDPKWAYYYARLVLEDPFKLGEPAIASDPKWAYQYALHVLEGPFKEGEPAIAKDPEWAYTYARDVLKGRFKAGEPAIASNHNFYYLYKKVLDKYVETKLDELNFKQAAVVGAAILAGATAHSFHQNIKRANSSTLATAGAAATKVNQAVGRIGQKMNDTAERIAELAGSILDKYNIGDKRAIEAATLAVKYEREPFPKAEDILAVIGIESSFNPSARSNMNAYGLMQVRPSVWGIKQSDLATPEQQVKFGSDVLHQYYQKLGDPRDALHAYNVGITNFKKGVNLNPKYVAKWESERELYE